MGIQAINGFNGVANPVQNLVGNLAITTLVMHLLSNLPGVGAAASPSAERQACEFACEPLPGGKDDLPERICVKTCEEGAEIIKTTTKESMKDGKWKVVGVLGKAVTPVAGYFDCTSVCGPSAIFNEGGNLVAAGLQYAFGDKEGSLARAAMAAAKAGCTAMQAIPYAGYGLCMSCCAGIKYAGIG